MAFRHFFFSLLLGGLLVTIAPRQICAQGWLDEAQDAAQSAVETAEDAVQKANPKEVILRRFGSNPTLERGAEQIRGALSHLEEVASTPPSPYKQLGSPWQASRKRAAPSAIEKLTGAQKAQYLGYEVLRGNREYKLYKVEKALIPYDPDTESIPLDQRLQRTLEASAVRGLSRPVSRRYFETIEDISSVTIEATTLINQYGTEGLQAFRQIESATVMGTSGATVVNGLVKSASGGVGLGNLEDALEGAVESAEEAERRARKMDRNAKKVQSGLRAIRDQEVPAERALEMKQYMTELGNVVRQTAEPYTRMRKSVSPVREGAQRLRAFADVPSVRFAAQSAYHIERAIATVESQIKEYASTFTRFSDVTERIASRRAKQTRSRLKSQLRQTTGPTLTGADTLHASLQKFIAFSGSKAEVEALRRYDRKLVSQTKEVRTLQSKDAVQALQANRALEKQIEDLPSARIQDLGEALVERIKKQKLVGAPETSGAKSVLRKITKDASPNEVAAVTSQIEGVKRSVRASNRMFYLFMGIFVLVFGGGVAWKVYA